MFKRKFLSGWVNGPRRDNAIQIKHRLDNDPYAYASTGWLENSKVTYELCETTITGERDDILFKTIQL